MLEVIFLLILIIIIIFQFNYATPECVDISGIYYIEQYDMIYKYNQKININIEKFDNCKFKIINVKSKSLLNDFYEEYGKELEAYITILNNELIGGQEIIYQEKFNNNFITYKGYINKNDIVINKNNNSIILFKKI